MTEQKQAVWLTRHEPTLAQQRVLNQNGFEIVRVSGEIKFDNGQHAFEMAVQANGGTPPTIVVAVIPPQMVAQFLRAAKAQSVELVRPVMEAVSRPNEAEPPLYQFIRFDKVVKMELVTEPLFQD